jgi:hypothetical protein
MIWFYFNILTWRRNHVRESDLIGGTDTLTFFLRLSKKHLTVSVEKAVPNIIKHVLFFDNETRPDLTIFITHLADDGPCVLQCKIGINFSAHDLSVQQIWENSQRALIDVTSQWNQLPHSFGNGLEFNLDLQRICWDIQTKDGVRHYKCIESISTAVRHPSVLQSAKNISKGSKAFVTKTKKEDKSNFSS